MKKRHEPRLYEIYLAQGSVAEDSWQKLFQTLSELSRPGAYWQIFTLNRNSKLHFYLETILNLPANLDGLPDFFFQVTSPVTAPTPKRLRLSPVAPTTNFIALQNHFEVKKSQQLISIKITFRKLLHSYRLSQALALTSKKQQIYGHILPVASPAQLLSIDFDSNRHLLYKSAPKYLDAQKILPFLSTSKKSALLQIETFPYHSSQPYLSQETIDFAKHSLVLGASGSGKSKFLSLFIQNLVASPDFQQKYKIIVIDPHAALENDIGADARVIDFATEADSIQLFSDKSRDPVVATELMLELFQSLLADNYNSKLARVLRHSVSMLLSLGKFNFHNLNQLLLDLEYRNQILQDRQNLPASSLDFFLTEYNEIKTRFYTEAISPIIALIDEIEMIPVLGKAIDAPDLEATVANNFLTLFSLDRTKLGDRVTTTLSGIIMQQLLTLIQNRAFKEHIIFIIDEVAVVENPILKRFLSEARKFNLSLILAGQYFGAISKALQTAIFANISNYYIFRVAKDDALTLVQSFDFKIPLDDTLEHKVKTFTDLQNRECIARVSCKDQLLPAVKGRTLDLTPHPRLKNHPLAVVTTAKSATHKVLNFTTTAAQKFQDFLTDNRRGDRRIKGDPFEDRIAMSPAKIKLRSTKHG